MTAVDFDLERFFGQATRAVVDSQNRLDREVNPESVSGARPGQRFFYSMPRASFALESEIDFRHKGRLLLRRKEKKTTLSHRVGFELVAVPEPPLPPRGEPSIELVEPAILIPDAEEERLAGDLVAALESGATGAGREWSFVNEAETRSLLEGARAGDKIRAEAALVAGAWEAPGQRNPAAPGGTHGRLVFFRLSGGRVLAARVVGSGKEGEKGKRDGLFVIRPGAVPRVVIYTFPGDPWPRQVSYEPLHLLARNARRWLAGELADQRSTWRPSGGLGFEDLDDFLDSLKVIIRDRLTDLARQTDPFAEAGADVVPGALPSFYDLAQTRARLRFSVETETGRVSFRKMLFGEDESSETEMAAAPEPAADSAEGVAKPYSAEAGPKPAGAAVDEVETDETVANQVAIRADQIQGRTEITVQLADLEFLPRAEAREALVELLVHKETSKVIAEEMGDLVRYSRLLASPVQQRDAVVFRARSPKPRKIAEELVVVWPGGATEKDRDFVFSCTRKGDKIDEVKKLMSLDDGMGDVRLSLKHFGPFHRLLAAVGSWRHRGRA